MFRTKCNWINYPKSGLAHGAVFKLTMRQNRQQDLLFVFKHTTETGVFDIEVSRFVLALE